MQAYSRIDSMITIDGSIGEGGGQVLRTALALSIATGRALRIENIRSKRPKPGLLRQHLTAVQAATAIGDAQVEGDAIGSTALTFAPRGIRSGSYRFAVGTAGSATLVMQTVLPPLLLAPGESTLVLEGGTHNPWAPPFDFLQRAFVPLVNRLGPQVETTLKRPGFYPAGGGAFSVTVRPAKTLGRFELMNRGEVVARRITAMVANLPRHIGEREVRVALDGLNWARECGSVLNVSDTAGPGNLVLIELHSEHVTEIATGFGEVGVAAEAVAGQAFKEMRRYLATGVPVGTHLADQLLTVLALSEGGVFRTVGLSRHSLTNIEVIRHFIDLRIAVVEEGRDVVRVEMDKRVS
jgi:RNA 3'-terminal phosphate cyclase (ATP)